MNQPRLMEAPAVRWERHPTDWYLAGKRGNDGLTMNERFLLQALRSAALAISPTLPARLERKGAA